MKRLVTDAELEALGNLMVRDYLQKSRKWNAKCFDNEAFISTTCPITPDLTITIRWLKAGQ